MYVNARKEAELVNPETGEYLELDLYLPALKLAFEYQVTALRNPGLTNTPFRRSITSEKQNTALWMYSAEILSNNSLQLPKASC